MTEEHEFTLAIDGDPNTDDNLNALFEAGCDDATFGSIDGAGYGTFTRVADSFEAAVLSAVRQIHSVDELRVLRIEPDDFVTATEIAERLDLTRQVIAMFVSGDRRKEHGPFPLPASHLTSRQRLWRWSEVIAWYYKSPDAPEARQAKWIADMNVDLELKTRLARDGIFGTTTSENEHSNHFLQVFLGAGSHARSTYVHERSPRVFVGHSSEQELAVRQLLDQLIHATPKSFTRSYRIHEASVHVLEDPVAEQSPSVSSRPSKSKLGVA